MSKAFESLRVPLLLSEIRRMMRLRWVGAAAVCAVGLAQYWWGDDQAHLAKIVVLGLVICAYNALLVGLLRSNLAWRASLLSLLNLASLQILADIVALSLLVFWTGGVSSPALGFFIFHMVFAALLQPRGRAYLIAILSIVIVCVGLWATGQWPRTFAGLMAIGAWSITACTTVVLTDRIARQLYRREQARLHQSQRLRNMSRRLVEQQARLVQQEKMVAMGQLAAGVAHEINNPLASMDGLLQLMQRSNSTPRPDSLAALREQIRRISRIVHQLTTFAHPGHGVVEVRPVNDVVRNALELVSFDKRLRRVRLESSLGEGVGTAKVDAHAMEQVITNITRNALDAMENIAEPRLVVRTWREGALACVEIADNGCGIAEEHRARLFEPFFTTKPVGKGTGLGLSISAKIIREHGGRIDVSSRPGEGTSFTIWLPLVEEPSGTVNGAGSVPGPGAGPRSMT